MLKFYIKNFYFLYRPSVHVPMQNPNRRVSTYNLSRRSYAQPQLHANNLATVPIPEWELEMINFMNNQVFCYPFVKLMKTQTNVHFFNVNFRVRSIKSCRINYCNLFNITLVPN